MKYIQISNDETLASLTEKVGVQNVDQIIADNGLTRAPNIGEQFAALTQQAAEISEVPDGQRKLSILSNFVDNADIYEKAALSDDREWKILSRLNTFEDHLLINDQIQDSVPDSYNILGNGLSLSSYIYSNVENALTASPEDDIDSSIFESVSTIQAVGITTNYGTSAQSSDNPMSWFNLPTNQITLYSSLSGESINIPAYPEQYNDSRVANYTTMPDLQYQYEPWQMYQSSGPRSNQFEFHLHRDMWTGNHLDGSANELIRFCEAQLYANYNGASVITPTVTLYVAGSVLISGIMTDVSVDWTGPIGHDGWYLEFTLRLSITEVSQTELNYSSVASKSLIG